MKDTCTKQKANNVVSSIICLEEKCENAEVVENLDIIQHAFSTEMLVDTQMLLDSNTFWLNYEIVKSAADGHCFVHSVLNSWLLQLPHYQCVDNVVSHDVLLGRLQNETYINSYRYVDYIDGDGLNSLRIGAKNYVTHKLYDTSYGDIVPYIMSNAIFVNFVIIIQSDNSYRVQLVECVCSNCPTLILFKNGAHYDAIAPKVRTHIDQLPIYTTTSHDNYSSDIPVVKNVAKNSIDNAHHIQMIDTAPNDNFQFLKKKGLHFIHLNVRSLIPKLDEIKLLLLKRNITVLALSETWLNDSVSDSEIDIHGYVVVRKDRNRHGGGVCLYVNCNIAFNPRIDLNIHDLESVWIELILPKTRPILTGVCYRPPKQGHFYDLLEQSCSQINDFMEMEIVLMGDFNTNILQQDKGTSLSESLINFKCVFCLTQLITEPTRICDNSETIIDLIFVSDSLKICQSGVRAIGLSDHLLIYCTRKVHKMQINKHNTVHIRSTKHYTKEKFIDMLQEIDWTNVVECNQVEIACEGFISKFTGALDLIAPSKQIRIKQRTQPWMSSEILDLIKQRDHYLSVFRRSKQKAHYDMFIIFRNQVKYNKMKAKASYYENAVNENKNDSSKLWKIL